MDTLPVYIGLLAFFTQIWVHEGSHLAMVKILAPESRIRSFKPWPHIQNKRLYMGRLVVDNPTPLRGLHLCYFLAAPLIGATIALCIYGALGDLFVLACISPLIDIAFWMLCAMLLPADPDETTNDGPRCMAAWKDKDAR
jgi:hypothetical protein